MEKMVLYPMPLNMVESDAYLHLWVQYQVESAPSTLKDLLADMNVPSTSYSYARKNGFLRSKKVLNAILRYFDLSLEIDPGDYDFLKDLLLDAITESYFIEGENLREIQKRLATIKHRVRHTPLYLLYALAYLNSCDHFEVDSHKQEMEEEVLPFLKFVRPSMTDDIAYFHLFSLTEYYFVTDRDHLAVTFTDQYETLDGRVDERLKTMGYYDLFTLYALKGNNTRALHYLEACHDLCFKYYNVKRLQALRQNKTAIYYRNENYQEALSNALGDLLYLYRQDPQENKVFFKSMLVIITTSLIYLGRYEEALEKTEWFFEFKVDDYYPQALLLKKFCHYKLEDPKSMDAVEDQRTTLESDIEFPEAYHVLSQLIEMLHRENKREMRSFGKHLKPLREDTMSQYNKIVSLLVDEYTRYLKKHGRYIDVLDMQ